MKIRYFLSALMLLLISTAAQAELMTPETLWSLSRLGDTQLSPDGKTFLVTISKPDISENTTSMHIYSMPSSGGEMRQLTFGGNHNYNPVWSPDSKKFAFISDRDGAPQAYIMNMGGGDPEKMTSMEKGVSFLSWSPDGKHLAFCSDVKLDRTIHEVHKDLDKVDAMVYDGLPVRHWDVWNDEYYRHLFVMPAEGGEPRDLMEGEKYDTPLKPFGGASQIAWAPNGTEIAYTAKKVKEFATSTNSDIYIAPVYGGKAKNITQGNTGFDMEPMYSPDGKYIAFHSQERPGYESDRIRLMIYTTYSGRISELSKDLDQWTGTTAWFPNSRGLYFSAGNNDGTSQLYQIDLNGKFKTLTSGNYNFATRALSVSPDGKMIYLSRENYNHPFELFSMSSAGGALKQLTDLNKEIFDKIETARIEPRWIVSADSAKVHCWVVYPPDFDPNKKYPMITYCQGGPQQPVSQYWSYGWNFLTMASKGYIIVAPNRRGVPGFGQEWVDAIRKDYGGQPMEDIMACTKALAAEPYVDENRLAAIGGSAGGYATFWLEGNDDGLYHAFVSHCGMFNMESKYGSTEELWFPNRDNGGPYWEVDHTQFYMEHSPHRHVQNWDTPILIITGVLDYRVPYTQSLEAFTAAQLKGVPSRLLVYPNENHWVLHPQEKVLWYREFFRFLQLYCKDK